MSIISYETVDSQREEKGKNNIEAIFSCSNF